MTVHWGSRKTPLTTTVFISMVTDFLTHHASSYLEEQGTREATVKLPLARC
jgi:hypothetical protein